MTDGTPCAVKAACTVWSRGKTENGAFAPFKFYLWLFFAITYYRAYKDIAKLADVLGHSSIETTRIYLLSSGAEHQRQLDRLGLVS